MKSHREIKQTLPEDDQEIVAFLKKLRAKAYRARRDWLQITWNTGSDDDAKNADFEEGKAHGFDQAITIIVNIRDRQEQERKAHG